ncbi:zinc finger protein 502 [Diaphorina citri]|uniref:Zinc finger protein 865 n=1 Tax=Diaphorina citri TaxID=121845 RepID=A0A1S4EBT3_DIACI|nr:zinc finger protein 502 [Diaphorina citri]
MSQLNPHLLQQQRKILIDNLLQMRTQQEHPQVPSQHNMNGRHSSHSLHPASGVSTVHNGASNMHSAPHHMNNANHYMMDPRHYSSNNTMPAYTSGNVQPVNLMGSIATMSNRQMSQPMSSNVIDLQQVPPKPPTTMPSQQVHEQQRNNLPHPMQQMHSIENMNNERHENQMQPTQHQIQHQLQHGQMSQQVPNTNVNQHGHTKDYSPLPTSPAVDQQDCQLSQPQMQKDDLLRSRQKKELPESLQELKNVKNGEQVLKPSESDEMSAMDVMSMMGKYVDANEEESKDIEKLVIEESASEDSDDEEDEDFENDENSSGKKMVKKFKCNICPKRYARKNRLTNHLRTHEAGSGDEKSEGGEGSFTCSQCPKTFVDKWHLNRHLKSHSENKVFRCEQCRFDFYVKREYNRHMKIHDGVKVFLCSVCSKTFTDKVKFNRHMRAHEGIKPFQCSVCSESFTQRSNLNIHLRIHDGIRPFQCNVCYICFTNKSDLNRHSRIHNGIKPFLCSMCAKCFSRKDDLNRHMKIHEGSKRYLCTMCPKCFTRKDDLNRHMRNHDGLKPFHCSVCFESFTQKALLNIHLRIHTNSKPHACSICTESFSQKSNLYIHLKLQHGVNPFKCDVCPNETFEKETQLSLHMRTVHGVKPFKCSMCDEGFPKKSVLKEHLRVSHNVNPFKCDICFKLFTKKSNLRTHIKTHEPIPCDKCPEIFEKKTDLQEHVDKCHNLHEEDEEEGLDEFDAPKEKSFNCSKCLNIVRIPVEIKVEVPFVCKACEQTHLGSHRYSTQELSLVEKLTSEGVPAVQAYEHGEDAARDADILVTATYSSVPVLKYEWLKKKDAHINAVGAGLNHHSELDAAIYSHSSIFFDSEAAARGELKGLYEQVPANMVGEVGGLIAANLTRDARYPLTVFHSMGMATEDVITAKLIYDKYQV